MTPEVIDLIKFAVWVFIGLMVGAGIGVFLFVRIAMRSVAKILLDSEED